MNVIDNSISLHKFPLYDKKRTRRWCEATHCKRKSVKGSSHICSLHFTKYDFVVNSTDNRKRTKNLKRRRLNDTVIPMPLHQKKSENCNATENGNTVIHSDKHENTSETTELTLHTLTELRMSLQIKKLKSCHIKN